MTLYEISREYSDFVIAVENGEIPEELSMTHLKC